MQNVLKLPIAMGDAAIRLHPGVGIRAWNVVRLDVDRVAEEGVWGPNAVLDIPEC